MIAEHHNLNGSHRPRISDTHGKQVFADAKEKEVTCKDCRECSHCMESSREYPCTDFKKKEGGEHGRGKEL